jgi:hypothetical protein
MSISETRPLFLTQCSSLNCTVAYSDSYFILLTTLIICSPKFIYITLKYSVLTSKKTRHISITRISWLVFFKEITDVHTENHTKPINTLWEYEELLTSESFGIYRYHSALTC